VFVIRQSHPEDVSTLSRMAKMVYFINLPPNEQIILSKIEHSNRCFEQLLTRPQPSSNDRKASSHVTGLAAMEQDSEFFMFSMEETHDDGAKSVKPSGDRVIGTSQVRAHQGGPGNPNWAFKITERRQYSESLKFGTAHSVGQLYGDESGPTEIGGLILQPSYRGHAARPGRLLSFVRFHFIGLHRAIFADRVLAEMMAPVSQDGDNILWDAFGRKFIPVKFAEADRFCQHNRSFIPELLPKEEIYLSLFPLEVQNALGVVSKETVPARRLLESMGFRYRGFIDPFDGGPHLDAPTDGIPLVKETRLVVAGKPLTGKERETPTPAIVSYTTRERGFRAVQVDVIFDESTNTARLPHAAMNALGAKSGVSLGFTPTATWHAKADALAKDNAAPARTPKPAGPARVKTVAKAPSKTLAKPQAKAAKAAKGRNKAGTK
jgi:arginine N-succinyltransferase